MAFAPRPVMVLLLPMVHLCSSSKVQQIWEAASSCTVLHCRERKLPNLLQALLYTGRFVVLLLLTGLGYSLLRGSIVEKTLN